MCVEEVFFIVDLDRKSCDLRLFENFFFDYLVYFFFKFIIQVIYI